MKVFAQYLGIGVALYVLTACSENINTHTHELAEDLLQAEQQHIPIPVLSIQQTDFDVTTALQVQKLYIQQKLQNDHLAGFKAGLTSAPSQKKFGVSQPVFGALFQNGAQAPGSLLKLKNYQRMMLETEIGFILNKTIQQPLPDITTLKNSVSTLVPVIEVPDLGFSDMKSLSYADILAANVSSRVFIVGEAVDWRTLDVNQIHVELSHDGKVINQGQGSDALGDQWQAALWLINQAVAQGWQLEKGHVLITGALGKMLPAKPGTYTADYQALGNITFEVK